MPNVAIRREVMDLLIMLDKSQAAGNMWTSTPGTVFEKDILQWAVTNELIEANTIDGEDAVYRITEAGQSAMIKDEAPVAHGTRPPKLKADMVKFLSMLAESNDWVSSQGLSLVEYPYYLRQTVQRKGYVEGRGNNAQREFKITAIGLAALRQTETPRALSAEAKQQIVEDSKARIRAQIKPPPLSIPSIESNDIVIQHASIDDSVSVQDAAASEFAMNIAEQIRNLPREVTRHVAVETVEDCADCDDCLYRDVVEILETRVPGVRDIVAGLKAIKNRP